MSSPSTRRAWIEIGTATYLSPRRRVALHPEGVDRNKLIIDAFERVCEVALHPEGVDRNMDCAIRQPCALVALHPEGVDRNG